MEEKMDYAEFILTKSICMFVDAILLFYELEDKVRSLDRILQL